MYSNAGFLFVGTALRQLALHKRRKLDGSKLEAGDEAWLQHTAGIIFDSAPAQLTPDIAARQTFQPAFSRCAQDIQHI